MRNDIALSESYGSSSYGSSSIASRLPEEILRHIFIMTLPDNHLDEDLSSSRIQTITFPLHLSHVSRFWRSVSLSLRQLWSFFSLSFDTSHRDKFETIVEIFGVFLERTRGCPLNFRIQCNMRHDEDLDARKQVEYIIEASLEQQFRWESVAFDWENVKLPVGFRQFGDFKIDNAPLLRTLRLNTSLMKPTTDEWIRWEPHPATIDISQCPRIQSLTVDGNYALEFGQGPSHSLSECKLFQFFEPSGAWCARMCVNVLTHAPNLQTLALKNEEGFELFPAFQSEVVVHGLRNLRIQYGPSSEILLDYINLPDLREFYYSDSLSGPPTGAVRSLGFLQRTRPVLTCLTIHGRYIEKNTVIEMLRLQPALIELDLRLHPAATNGVLRALDLRNRAGWFGIEEDESVLCRGLRTLRLRKATSHTREWRRLNALFPMIRLRHESLHTLNLVCIQNKRAGTEIERRVRMGLSDLDRLVSSATFISATTMEDPDARMDGDRWRESFCRTSW